MKLDILAFAAHPDDVELSCAGTLMVHAAKGMKTGVVDITLGELGSRGTAKTRKEEAAAAAQILGLSVRENLKLPDGFFENNKASQLELIKAIRKHQPDIVLANAPEDRHPDHVRASRLISESCFLAGLIKVETSTDGMQQQAWRPKQVFHFIQDNYIDPDFIVDISPFIEKKKEAIKSFKTQFLAQEEEEVQTYISSSDFFDSVIYRAKLYGRMIGVAYGEGFIAEKKLGVKDFQSLIW